MNIECGSAWCDRRKNCHATSRNCATEVFRVYKIIFFENSGQDLSFERSNTFVETPEIGFFDVWGWRTSCDRYDFQNYVKQNFKYIF